MASKNLGYSDGKYNGPQEDALPPARRKEPGHGAVSVERDVGAATLATVSRIVPTNSTPSVVGTARLRQKR